MRIPWKVSVMFMALCLEMATATDEPKLKADCLTQLCNCTTQVDQFKTVEFRVLCIGTGTQAIILDDEIFKDEAKPDWTRKIYVRMTNFSSLTVDNSFISRWQAYTSCSFDIWNCLNTMFSSEAPPVAINKAKLHAFAGIGVIESEVNSFPPMIFREKREAGLRLTRSQVIYLDIVSMGALTVNYLLVKDSTIGKIGGSRDKTIKLEKSDKHGNPKVYIQNSKIGIIAKGGMAFNDYGSSSYAQVVVNNSTIGFLEEGAINIGRKFSIIITLSNIGLIPPGSLSVKRPGIMAIEKNVLRIQGAALKNLTCLNDAEISNNLIIPDCWFKICHLLDASNDFVCKEPVESDFIDQSCGKNYIWSFQKPELNLVISNTTNSIQVSEETKPMINYNASETPYLERKQLPNPEELVQNSVPMGLFYLTIGLCLALLVIVIGLAVLIAFGKMSKKTLVINNENRKRSSVDYEDYDEPSVHFFNSNAPPLPSIRKSSDDKIKKEQNYYQN